MRPDPPLPPAAKKPPAAPALGAPARPPAAAGYRSQRYRRAARRNAQRGGLATLQKYGRDHYRALAVLANATRVKSRWQKIGVRLRPDQMERLRALSAQTSAPLATLVREAVDHWLTLLP